MMYSAEEDKNLFKSLSQWRRRLLACTNAEGGHFEHHPELQTSRENFTLVF